MVEPKGDRCAAGRPGYQPADWPSRPRTAAGRRPDRAAGLRADRTVLPGRPSRSGSPRVLCRQGTQQRCTPLTAQTVAVLRGWLAEQRGRSEDPVFPTSRGRPLGRDAVAARHQPRDHGAAALPLDRRQDDHPARPASLDHHDAIACGRGHICDRALTRPRENRHSPDLPARRYSPERTRPRPHHTPPCRAGPIPPRHAARLPRGAVIMPSPWTQIPYPANDSAASSA
jgi:hypothetical protein